MAIDDRVIERIKLLIEEGSRIVHEKGPPQGLDPAFGWVISVTRVVEIVCPNPKARYITALEELQEHHAPFVQVPLLVPLLTNLLSDIEAGMLVSVADQARAEVFDDFLDMGEHYLDAGQVPQAGVIVSAVFEDTLKKICRKHGIEDKGTAEPLINSLKAAGKLTSNKAKGAKRAADLRNAALHADWQSFDVHDVKASLEFTRQWIAQELDG
jgi:uncharacterized protein YutE (UPF0331/DUF86 family)